MIWSFAFFALLHTGATPMIVAAMVVGLVLHGALYGPMAAALAELFPTEYRYSGASFCYQMTSIFSGSVAPIIAVALLQATGSSLPISVYGAAMCAVSVLAIAIARETRGRTFAEIDGKAR